MNSGSAGGPPRGSTSGAEPRVVPLPYVRPDPAEALAASEAFLGIMSTRRSVRQFSTEPVPVELVVNAVATAGTAPSDERPEPWTFVVVSNPELKQRTREAVAGGAYLSDAPYLVVIFEQGASGDVGKRAQDLAGPAVGIACGFLLASLHMSGLATLVHRPGPARSLAKILLRPAGERAFLIVAAGYPAPDAVVPDLPRKALAEILHVLP